MNEQDNDEKRQVTIAHKKKHSIICGILIAKEEGHICFEEEDVYPGVLNAFKKYSGRRLCKECFSETIVEDFEC